TQRYVDAVRAIDERQATYYNQAAQKAAVHFLQAHDARTRAERRLEESRKELAARRAEYERVQGEREENERRRRAARAELEVLEQHEAFRDQRQLEALGRELAGARDALARAEKAFAEGLEQRRRLEDRGDAILKAWEE